MIDLLAQRLPAYLDRFEDLFAIAALVDLAIYFVALLVLAHRRRGRAHG